MIILTTNLSLKNNNTAYFYDRTTNNGANGYGIGGNITYADVKAIRLLTANYSTLESPSAPTAGDFVQYVQYIKISGESETIDGKVFVAGDVFVPQSTGLTTATPDDWNTTGYYVYPFLDTWLPTAAQTPLEISVGQFNQDSTNIADNEYIYGYEIYYNQQDASFTSEESASYMVLSGTAETEDGNVYVEGEVFITSSSESVIVSGSVVQLYAATSGYATLVYQIKTDLNDLIEQQIGLNNQDLVQPQESYILKIRTKIEALEYSSETSNVSLLYAYQTILAIQARINQLLHP